MTQTSEHSKPRAVWLFERLYSLLNRWILLPLLGALIGAVIISRITNRILGPSSYKIYVVGNMNTASSVSQQIFEQFDKAFEARGEDLKDFGGVALKVVREDDRGDPAHARQIAEKIARQPDTLLVIGHGASSQSKEALPAYLTAAPPIPVILTTETNPDLVPARIKKHAFRPVFRLEPTDKDQARVAADFIARRASAESKAIWVVQDLSGISGNSVYSSFLADQFVKDVQDRARVVLWSNNLNAPSPSALRVLNIGWVFFAGNWRPALVLIRELRGIFGNQMPRIVLSDASAHQELIAEGGSDVNGVYVTYPMRVAEKGNGYFVFGENAASVVKALIQSADNSSDFDEIAQQDEGIAYRFRSLMGIRRVQDARSVLGSLMQEAEEERQSFGLSNGGKIQFGVDEDGEDGVRVDPDAKFYIWQVNNKAFTDLPDTGSRP